jgi:hypothetical protein
VSSTPVSQNSAVSKNSRSQFPNWISWWIWRVCKYSRINEEVNLEEVVLWENLQVKHRVGMTIRKPVLERGWPMARNKGRTLTVYCELGDLLWRWHVPFSSRIILISLDIVHRQHLPNWCPRFVSVSVCALLYTYVQRWAPANFSVVRFRWPAF